jgi:hypothetical protein
MEKYLWERAFGEDAGREISGIIKNKGCASLH